MKNEKGGDKMEEYVKELKKQLEEFLGFSVDSWILEEALQEAERCGATVYWRSLQKKLGEDLKIKL